MTGTVAGPLLQLQRDTALAPPTAAPCWRRSQRWGCQIGTGSEERSNQAPEVVRRQSDGSSKYIIDNPDGTALLDHE